MTKGKDKNSDDEGEEPQAQGGVTSQPSAEQQRVDPPEESQVVYRDEEDGVGLFLEK